MEEILSELIRQMKDPRVAGMVSVTRVQVTQDVSVARVFISVMGTEEQRRDTIRALEHASGFLRSKLGEELTIRHVPQLQFTLDRSVEQGDSVIALINQLDIPPPSAESAPALEPGEDEEAQEEDAEADEDGDGWTAPVPPSPRPVRRGHPRGR
jgi:ribosome-binding factor A